jgi:hypothetical protein
VLPLRLLLRVLSQVQVQEMCNFDGTLKSVHDFNN